MLKGIDADRIWAMLTWFQKMERFTNNSKTLETVKTIIDTIKSFQIAVDTIYTHSWSSGAPNIVVEKKGFKNPNNEIYMLGGHYDVTATGMPGADDNGSGSISTIDAIRILLNGFKYEKTIRFVIFSGEENGLKGSAAYARQCKDKGEKIAAYINMDMICWNDASKVQVFVAYKKAQPELFKNIGSIAKLYLPSDAPVVDGSSSSWLTGSDHASFWNNGYQAVYLGDDLIGKNHPYYHKKTDLVGTAVNSKPTFTAFFTTALSYIATAAGISENTGIRESGHDVRGTVASAVFLPTLHAVSIACNSKGMINSDVSVEIFSLRGERLFAHEFVPVGNNSHLVDTKKMTAGVYQIVIKQYNIHLLTKQLYLY